MWWWLVGIVGGTIGVPIALWIGLGSLLSFTMRRNWKREIAVLRARKTSDLEAWLRDHVAWERDHREPGIDRFIAALEHREYHEILDEWEEVRSAYLALLAPLPKGSGRDAADAYLGAEHKLYSLHAVIDELNRRAQIDARGDQE
jgi:hypothetical protein